MVGRAKSCSKLIDMLLASLYSDFALMASVEMGTVVMQPIFLKA